jgi:hypothetical protein
MRLSMRGFLGVALSPERTNDSLKDNKITSCGA